MTKNYYDILGLEENASTEKIVTMYKKLAKKYHTDINSMDSELQSWSHKMMVELNEAYYTLKDQEKRKKYNQQQTKMENDEFEQEDVCINNWEHAKQLLTDVADQIPLGAPNAKLEKEVKKIVHRNINKRIKNYIHYGVPNSYSTSYMDSVMDNLIADSIDQVQEQTIRTRIAKIFGFVWLILSGIFIFRHPIENNWIGGLYLLGIYAGGIFGYYTLTWFGRIISHGLKYKLINTRGLFVNGVIALFLILQFSFTAFGAQDLDGWVEIVSPDHNFSICLPSKPTLQHPNYHEEYDAKLFSLDTRNVGYKIIWFNTNYYMENLDDFVEATKESVEKDDMQVRILRDEKISEGEHILAYDIADETSMVIKTISDGERLY